MQGIVADSASAVAPLAKWRSDFSRAFQYYLDRSTPHPVQRWLGTGVAAAIYILRVYYVQGFYVISYGLGIYIFILLIGFLLPKVDPELENSDTASLPTRGAEELRTFVRRLPEFKFWYSITKAFCIAFPMTLFSIFDVPVFWPILLCYWMVLCFLTMKRQIMHMIKYKFIPFDLGKQRYTGKKSRACPPSKVREEKLGDQIAALHQLVAPFGKTDTASVLMEAISYIKFLQNQVEALSAPYMKSLRTRPMKPTQMAQVEDMYGSVESRRDLRSCGLCLVPLSCMSYVTNDGDGGWPSSDDIGAT